MNQAVELRVKVLQEIGPVLTPEQRASGHTVRLTVDLQENFALNQPLSPFALAALDLLGPETPSYALDVVSVIEATLQDPRPILMAQQNVARREAVDRRLIVRRRIGVSHAAAHRSHVADLHVANGCGRQLPA